MSWPATVRIQREAAALTPIGGWVVGMLIGAHLASYVSTTLGPEALLGVTVLAIAAASVASRQRPGSAIASTLGGLAVAVVAMAYGRWAAILGVGPPPLWSVVTLPPLVALVASHRTMQALARAVVVGRDGPRFGLRGLLAFTTVVAAYAAAVGPAWPAYCVDPTLFGVYAGMLLVRFGYRLATASHDFIEGWEKPAGFSRRLVEPRIEGSRQLLAGALGAATIGLVRLVEPDPPPILAWTAAGAALVTHGLMASRTAITLYDNGVVINDKLWMWSDGELALVTRNDVTRLAPAYVANEPDPVWRRWPVVPAANREAVVRMLAEQTGADK